MVKIAEIVRENAGEEIVKQENDRSYKTDSGITTDDQSIAEERELAGADDSNITSSGYQTSEGDSSKKWMKVKNEVVDLEVFDPPFLQSTDLRLKKDACFDISTIEHANNMPRMTQGMIRNMIN